jgi:hypothetical protein
MNNVAPDSLSRKWYVAKYPALAWVETVIKVIAILIGIVALSAAFGRGSFAMPGGLRLAEFAVMAFLAIGLERFSN